MIWRALAAGEADILAAAAVQTDPYLRLGYRAETLISYLTRPDSALERYAIETNGQLAGLLCLRRPWLRGPLIEMLVLLPHARGQGLGSAILARGKSEAGRNLWATVSAFHSTARRFYQSRGFQELCDLPGLISPHEAEILLRWQQATEK